MMPVHALLTVEDDAEWDAALDGIPHSFAHTREYCAAMSLSSGLPTRLYRYTCGDARFVCPISERGIDGYTDLTTPVGFSGFVGRGDVKTFLGHWRDHAEASGWVCGYIGLNPLIAPKEFAAAPDYFPADNEIFILDLSRSEAELASKLSTNRKRQLKRFAAEGLQVVSDRSLVLNFFLEHLDEFLKDKGASGSYRIPSEAIHRLLASEGTLALAVAPGGMVEAAVLFGYTSHCADYIFGISLEEGKRHMAALIWHGAMLLRDAGVAALNLGGGIRRNDGVADFKLRFGAERVEFGSLKQIYMPDEYSRLCRLMNADPGNRESFFPAYRAPSAATSS